MGLIPLGLPSGKYQEKFLLIPRGLAPRKFICYAFEFAIRSVTLSGHKLDGNYFKLKSAAKPSVKKFLLERSGIGILASEPAVCRRTQSGESFPCLPAGRFPPGFFCGKRNVEKVKAKIK